MIAAIVEAVTITAAARSPPMRDRLHAGIKTPSTPVYTASERYASTTNSAADGRAGHVPGPDAAGNHVAGHGDPTGAARARNGMPWPHDSVAASAACRSRSRWAPMPGCPRPRHQPQRTRTAGQIRRPGPDAGDRRRHADIGGLYGLDRTLSSVDPAETGSGCRARRAVVTSTPSA